MWSWSNDGKRIRLNVKKIRDDFYIKEDGNLIFIRPKYEIWGWEDKERFLRSIIINKDGYVVSCSWPKFGNYGEFNTDTELLNEMLRINGNVIFSHKEDGSLCIRSIINDKVILRTRGTMYGESEIGNKTYAKRFYEVAANKYPILLDKNWMNDRSLLFEFVSQDNLIVVRYKKTDLIFLGSVKHSDLTLGSWNELQHISNTYGLNLVKLCNLPKNPIELIENVKQWKDEGIVARFSGDQVMVKIKSSFYLAQHRLKFSVNYKFIVEFIELSGIKSESELIDELRSYKYDWEIIQTVVPFYHRYLKAEKKVNNIINRAKKVLENFYSDKTDEIQIRKELAFSIKDLERPIKSMIFLLYDNNYSELDVLKRKWIYEEKVL